ncbi:hypothetical protein GH808_02050 [Acetobacterium fimetarium]|uniref:Uncharacterized protein n=1 Tax=Acetobacterium fimetarium TaxID=52691 RepID=A0ABR6WRK3_9FIRM|nr:hypothetical protein [Acetobacterium fimetarium]MBC3803227.1 hypothetical protein [Acetobacterium fimetarium]
MKTELLFLVKRLCDLEEEFMDLSEEEKEIVVTTAESMTGSLLYLFEALEDYCMYGFDDEE